MYLVKKGIFMRKKFFIVFPIILIVFAIFVSFATSACTNNTTNDDVHIVNDETNAVTINDTVNEMQEQIKEVHEHIFIQTEIYPSTCMEDGKSVSVCECGNVSEKVIVAVYIEEPEWLGSTTDTTSFC